MLAAALRETLQRNWNAAAIAESLPIQGWKQNVTQLSEFILTRCARTGELAVPTGEG
jgi:hypothetical protein